MDSKMNHLTTKLKRYPAESSFRTIHPRSRAARYSGSKIKKKILITGALGHIGSSLLRNLGKNIAKEVVILDSLESRRYPSLYDLPKEFKFKFIMDDVVTADFSKYLKGVDIVIHLAALTDAEGTSKIPERVRIVNFNGLQNVADACCKKGVKLLFPSTTSVYGSQDSIVDENCTELKPQSPYAREKLNAEIYLAGLGKKNGLKYVICRFGTIFGYSVGMRYDTAVNKFTWQAVNGIPLTVWKTAWEQKRPYLYLGDCTKAINFITDKDLFDGQIYNVTSENFTVKDVVKTISRFIPKLNVSYVDSPIMNQLSYEVDDKKFRKLGFKPNGDLKTGIKETVDQLKGIIHEN